MSVITISRQFGAGGRTLGEMVAKRLGYEFYDNEVIQMVSIHAKVSADSVDALEKATGGLFNRFIADIVPRSLKDLLVSRKQETIDEEIYVDILHKIITEIAEDANAVIIGRGSQYILKDHEDTFHVLIIADINDRVKFFEEKYDLTQAQAVRAVSQDDRRRANLYRKFNVSDYDQPDRYHLVLNTSKLDFDVACDLICELVKS
ncbi:MAG: cytidylate kinase-like family protein [Desulfobacterales bacterium]|jgi:cytidylate kinase